MLDIVPSRNTVQCQGKLMMQNPNYRPNIGLPKKIFLSFTSTSYILLQATILYNLKKN